MNIQVYDIETLSNCFTVTFWDLHTRDEKQFVIHHSQNDFKEFVEFCMTCDGMVGFNNVGFDYPVIHPLLVKPAQYKKMSGDELAKEIYKRAQLVISWNNPELKGKVKREWITPLVEQRDLYLIWHFNNKARSTSLKWLEICMGYPDVREMPINHKDIVTTEQIGDILSYNSNDVGATLEFYHRSISKIEFRKNLTDKYEVNMMNYSDNKIGEKILISGVAKKSGQSEAEIMKTKTFRPFVRVSDCLLPDIAFQSKEFNEVLDHYKKLIITDTKGEPNVTCVVDGVTYDFGFGGLHALRSNGVYTNVVSADVSSYYPNLAISNRLHPRHLGEPFCDVYKELYHERQTYAKGSTENNGLKLSLNGVFGQSNSPFSVFYDPQFTMSVTLNGQFLLAMLCEEITLNGAGGIIMVNTDGIEVDVRDEARLQQACDDWQRKFSLSLEFSRYRLLAVRDVNNYIAIYDNGKPPKTKGDFETDKEIFKDQSMKIVPIAVKAYFVSNTPIEETINDCTDLSLFIIGHRAKTGNLRYRAIQNNEFVNQKIPKNVRYFISNTGGSIVKVTKGAKKKKGNVISENQMGMFGVGVDNSDVNTEKIINLHVGCRMVMMNQWVNKPFNEYGVNKLFYIKEARKLINAIINKQTVI